MKRNQMLNYHKRILVILALLAISSSCQDKLIIGTYKSKRFSRPEMGILYLTKGITGQYVNSVIELKSDSTFRFTTCGNIMKGIWDFRADSLLLYIKTNRLRKDSPDNTHYYDYKKYYEVFKYRNKKLTAISYNSRHRKIIEKLKFESK